MALYIAIRSTCITVMTLSKKSAEMPSTSGVVSVPTLGETAFRKLPNFYRTTIRISTLLDVEQPLGNDYRAVLELLGFSPEEVRFWGCKCRRPTLEALVQWEGTVQDLAGALQECERFDALSVLIQALIETLQDAHKPTGKLGTNMSTKDAFSEPPVRLPTTLRWSDIDTCPRADSLEHIETTDDSTSDGATSLTSPLSSYKDEPFCVSDQVTTKFHSQEAQGLPLPDGDDATGTLLMTTPKQELDALLKEHFKIPGQIALTCLQSNSNTRKTTEFICNIVAVAASKSRCISNSGDLTWMSNTTVYINNFARGFLLLVAFINVATCVFGAHHTPLYTLELVIAAVPVIQSLFVEQNLPLYRDFIRKIKEMEASMSLITRTLERGPGTSLINESNMLKELDVRKAKLNQLKLQVLPVYSDIRLCIICTMVLEILLMFFILSVGLMFYTGEELLDKIGDGFTSLAIVLMCVDCTYNFAIVAVYYHDRTVETILRKDRFRLNASLCQELDTV